MRRDIDELTERVKQFCELRDWDQFHNPKDLAIGLSTEANELLDLFRFKTEEQMRDVVENVGKRQEISEELEDIFSFCSGFPKCIHLSGCWQKKRGKSACQECLPDMHGPGSARKINR